MRVGPFLLEWNFSLIFSSNSILIVTLSSVTIRCDNPTVVRKRSDSSTQNNDKGRSRTESEVSTGE